MTDVWEEELCLGTELRGCLIESLTKSLLPQSCKALKHTSSPRLSGAQTHKPECLRSSHTQKLSSCTTCDSSRGWIILETGVAMTPNRWLTCKLFSPKQLFFWGGRRFACIRNPVWAGWTHYVYSYVTSCIVFLHASTVGFKLNFRSVRLIMILFCIVWSIQICLCGCF